MLELLGTMLFITILAMIIGAGWLIRYILVIHPQQEQDSLALFSVISVSDVLLRHPKLDEEQQRQKAEQRLRDILTERGLTLTGDSIISACIGWAMHKKMQEEEKIDLEKLKAEIEHAGIDKMITSVKLPAIRKKPKPAPKTPLIDLEGIIL